MSLGFKAGRPHSTPTFPSGCFNIDWLTCSAMYIEQMDESEFARTTYVLGRPFKHGSYSLKKAGPGTSCDGGTAKPPASGAAPGGGQRWTATTCLRRRDLVSQGTLLGKWCDTASKKSAGKQNIQTMLMNCQRLLAKSWPRNQDLHCLSLKFTPISTTRFHLGSAGETSGSRICETMGSVGARQPLLTSTVPGITLVGEKRPADTDREGERNCDF